jgi:hypothetical protein
VLHIGCYYVHMPSPVKKNAGDEQALIAIHCDRGRLAFHCLHPHDTAQLQRGRTDHTILSIGSGNAGVIEINTYGEIFEAFAVENWRDLGGRVLAAVETLALTYDGATLRAYVNEALIAGHALAFGSRPSQDRGHSRSAHHRLRNRWLECLKDRRPVNHYLETAER